MGKCTSKERIGKSLHSRVKNLPASRNQAETSGVSREEDEKQPFFVKDRDGREAIPSTTREREDDDVHTKLLSTSTAERSEAAVNVIESTDLPDFPVLDHEGNPLEEKGDLSESKSSVTSVTTAKYLGVPSTMQGPTISPPLAMAVQEHIQDSLLAPSHEFHKQESQISETVHGEDVPLVHVEKDAIPTPTLKPVETVHEGEPDNLSSTTGESTGLLHEATVHQMKDDLRALPSEDSLLAPTRVFNKKESQISEQVHSEYVPLVHVEKDAIPPPTLEPVEIVPEGEPENVSSRTGESTGLLHEATVHQMKDDLQALPSEDSYSEQDISKATVQEEKTSLLGEDIAQEERADNELAELATGESQTKTVLNVETDEIDQQKEALDEEGKSEKDRGIDTKFLKQETGKVMGVEVDTDEKEISKEPQAPDLTLTDADSEVDNAAQYHITTDARPVEDIISENYAEHSNSTSVEESSDKPGIDIAEVIKLEDKSPVEQVEESAGGESSGIASIESSTVTHEDTSLLPSEDALPVQIEEVKPIVIERSEPDDHCQLSVEDSQNLPPQELHQVPLEASLEKTEIDPCVSEKAVSEEAPILTTADDSHDGKKEAVQHITMVPDQHDVDVDDHQKPVEEAELVTLQGKEVMHAESELTATFSREQEEFEDLESNISTTVEPDVDRDMQAALNDLSDSTSETAETRSATLELGEIKDPSDRDIDEDLKQKKEDSFIKENESSANLQGTTSDAPASLSALQDEGDNQSGLQEDAIESVPKSSPNVDMAPQATSATFEEQEPQILGKVGDLLEDAAGEVVISGETEDTVPSMDMISSQAEESSDTIEADGASGETEDTVPSTDVISSQAEESSDTIEAGGASGQLKQIESESGNHDPAPELSKTDATLEKAELEDDIGSRLHGEVANTDTLAENSQKSEVLAGAAKEVELQSHELLEPGTKLLSDQGEEVKEQGIEGAHLLEQDVNIEANTTDATEPCQVQESADLQVADDTEVKNEDSISEMLDTGASTDNEADVDKRVIDNTVVLAEESDMPEVMDAAVKQVDVQTHELSEPEFKQSLVQGEELGERDTDGQDELQNQGSTSEMPNPDASIGKTQLEAGIDSREIDDTVCLVEHPEMSAAAVKQEDVQIHELTEPEVKPSSMQDDEPGAQDTDGVDSFEQDANVALEQCETKTVKESTEDNKEDCSTIAIEAQEANSLTENNELVTEGGSGVEKPAEELIENLSEPSVMESTMEKGLKDETEILKESPEDKEEDCSTTVTVPLEANSSLTAGETNIELVATTGDAGVEKPPEPELKNENLSELSVMESTIEELKEETEETPEDKEEDCSTIVTAPLEPNASLIEEEDKNELVTEGDSGVDKSAEPSVTESTMEKEELKDEIMILRESAEDKMEDGSTLATEPQEVNSSVTEKENNIEVVTEGDSGIEKSAEQGLQIENLSEPTVTQSTVEKELNKEETAVELPETKLPDNAAEPGQAEEPVVEDSKLEDSADDGVHLELGIENASSGTENLERQPPDVSGTQDAKLELDEGKPRATNEVELQSSEPTVMQSTVEEELNKEETAVELPETKLPDNAAEPGQAEEPVVEDSKLEDSADDGVPLELGIENASSGTENLERQPPDVSGTQDAKLELEEGKPRATNEVELQSSEPTVMQSIVEKELNKEETAVELPETKLPDNAAEPGQAEEPVVEDSKLEDSADDGVPLELGIENASSGTENLERQPPDVSGTQDAKLELDEGKPRATNEVELQSSEGVSSIYTSQEESSPSDASPDLQRSNLHIPPESSQEPTVSEIESVSNLQESATAPAMEGELEVAHQDIEVGTNEIFEEDSTGHSHAAFHQEEAAESQESLSCDTPEQNVMENQEVHDHMAVEHKETCTPHEMNVEDAMAGEKLEIPHQEAVIQDTQPPSEPQQLISESAVGTTPEEPESQDARVPDIVEAATIGSQGDNSIVLDNVVQAVAHQGDAPSDLIVPPKMSEANSQCNVIEVQENLENLGSLQGQDTVPKDAIIPDLNNKHVEHMGENGADDRKQAETDGLDDKMDNGNVEDAPVVKDLHVDHPEAVAEAQLDDGPEEATVIASKERFMENADDTPALST